MEAMHPYFRMNNGNFRVHIKVRIQRGNCFLMDHILFTMAKLHCTIQLQNGQNGFIKIQKRSNITHALFDL